MTEPFSNVYADRTRAAAYARLEFPGTYYLAFRDLPEIIRTHVTGRTALDFGCGAGRSTRFLRELGFQAVGVDISGAMLSLARERDPEGDYREVPDGDLSDLPQGSQDLVLSAFTFDNIPTREKKLSLFRALKRLLRPHGRIVNVVSTPEIYVNEWASFSTRDYPENRGAKDGDPVRIVMLDVEDRRPVEDIIWSREAYLEVYRQAGLSAIRIHHPLGRADEPQPWVSEVSIAPWSIHVLAPES